MTQARIAPLQGLRILDFSRVLAGPLCTQYLGDLGAEVIKVESIERGDDSRHWPAFRDVPAGERFGTPFLAANRNKRSIAIDLKSAAGQALCHRLAESADVVVTSFAPGVAERLKVDADTLMALNPRLIHCNISGYGTSGPMRDGKGYDVILQAFTGMLSITGAPGGPPVRSPFSPVDQGTGLHALIGILAALQQRHATGRGTRIDASLFDTSVAFLAYFLQGYWERGSEPDKPGSGHESLCPYEVFQASDKPLILGVANDQLWRRFCAVAGLNDIVDDPRFCTNAQRVRHRAETVARVRACIAQRPRDEWIALLDAQGIPCSPLHTLGELSAHPHTQASDMLYEQQHAVLGRIQGVAQPLRFDSQRPAPQRPPPDLGEHTAQILAELGMPRDDIERLARDGVISSPADNP